MARKRKELPELQNFKIEKVAAEGKSLGHWNDLVVFVPYGAPGDEVTVKLLRKRHNYAEGVITNLTKPSQLRVEPKCEHFGVCGGCKWQHLPYEYQLENKRQQVVDALERIAKVELPEINPILGSKEIYGYRNKLEFTFSNKSWLTQEQLESGVEFADRNAAGFHIPGAFDKVLDIKHCYLQGDINNRVRLFIRSYCVEKGYGFYDLRAQQGFIRMIMLRTASTGEIMLVVVFGENNKKAIDEIMSAVANEFTEITSLYYVINLKVNDSLTDQEHILYRGKPYIEEEMEGLRFRVGPKSFYQTNSRQAYELYKVARRMAGLTGKEVVYDLYTGTGTIANFVSRQASKVVGVEYVPEAIEDARINSDANGITNIVFYAGDMKDVLTDEFVKVNGKPDVMIIDPPRAGMHEDVIKVILNTMPKRLVYVSCNPATQARDISLLDVKYKVVEVQPVDMFPHTHHVENVCLLTLR